MVVYSRQRLKAIMGDQDFREQFADIAKIAPDFSMDIIFNVSDQPLLVDFEDCGPSPPAGNGGRCGSYAYPTNFSMA